LLRRLTRLYFLEEKGCGRDGWWSSSGTIGVSAVTQAITEEGVKKPYQVLDALGYAVKWRGLDPEESIVYKRER